MNGISLFSGAGGFELGFERAGIRTVLQAESDPWCLEVLTRHWPDVERVTDVREVDAATWNGRCRDVVRDDRSAHGEWVGDASRSAAGVDLIYGGFPCQDVSVAGKRAGLSGKRSGLWHEFRRVLRELRPRWTVIENVPGLLSSHSGRDFATILLELEDLGYGWAYRVLDARWFGVPQRRRRVFVVGCLGDARRAAQVLAVCESCGGHPAPCRETGQAVAYTLAGSSPDTSRRIGNAWNTTYLPFGGNRTSGSINVASSRSSRANRYDFDTDTFLVAETVRSHPRPGSNSLGNMTGVRRLTPLECERLMGWPDEWTRWTADGREITDSQRYRMCGNGVVATVVEWLGHRLVRADALLEHAA